VRRPACVAGGTGGKASGWTKIGKTTATGWKFKGAVGPIRQVPVKSDQIVVKGGKSLWTYTLDEASEGRVAVRLRLGSDSGWCADAPAQVKGNPPSTAANDRPGKFPPVCLTSARRRA
jgi:hypothetical protein